MDYIPSDMLRGHLDTIILLSLVDNDKHTNQIKEVIENRSGGQFVLKQGTFYSCLQRITKQGFVTEYRTTDEDGVRRKFFQLTEKGKTYIDSNKDSWAFSKHVLDLLIAPSEKQDKKEADVKPVETSVKVNIEPETPAQTEIKKEEDGLNSFLKFRIDDEPSDTLSNKDLSYIDFTQAETVFTATNNAEQKNKAKKDFEQLSMVEDKPSEIKQKAVAENKKAEKPEQQFMAKPTEIATEKPQRQSVQNEIDDSNFTGDTTDYKSVLEKIFGQTPSYTTSSREIRYEEGVDVEDFFNEKKSVTKPLKAHKQSEAKKDDLTIYSNQAALAENNSFYDFTDVLDLASEEGFKIRISSKDNKKDVPRILINKLNMFSSIIFFSIILAETLLIALLTSTVAELQFGSYMLFIGVLALFPIVNAIIYFISPNKKIRSLPSFKNSVELSLIICLNLLLIDVVCCVLGAMDFSSYTELTRYLFYPILFIIDLPVYVIIKYTSLQKSVYYE